MLPAWGSIDSDQRRLYLQPELTMPVPLSFSSSYGKRIRQEISIPRQTKLALQVLPGMNPIYATAGFGGTSASTLASSLEKFTALLRLDASLRPCWPRRRCCTPKQLGKEYDRLEHRDEPTMSALQRAAVRATNLKNNLHASMIWQRSWRRRYCCALFVFTKVRQGFARRSLVAKNCTFSVSVGVV